jgi:superfamily II DNA or RNA helicase/HKD family nuclease
MKTSISSPEHEANIISSNKLVSGGKNPLLPHLCQSISRADQIDFSVAFITTAGLRLLLPDLHDALEPNPEANKKPAQLRILTSDYLGVTDPDALRLLLLLQQKGADVRIYEAADRSFHMKAYLFANDTKDDLQGAAFIGSSNITSQALQGGLEWNYRIDYPVDTGFIEARQQFEILFNDLHTRRLTDEWIEAYEARRKPPYQPVAPGSHEKELPPTPTHIQLEVLAALTDTRSKGFQRGLVVLATGLGKTWISAFDAEQAGARRVLFVAHREEILNQAAETFLRIRPTARVGFYKGERRDKEVDILFASIQTLSRISHLQGFSPQHFDYVIIDEFHHAAAGTYHRVLDYFLPRFLLGLTATPDRTDQTDILNLCDGNLVFSCNLFTGIEQGLLSPFHYYGIYDDNVDYQHIPWRNGRFDPEQLSNKLATLARARHALEEWRRRGQRRTLAFCASIRHADFMADYFSKARVPSAAVYAGSSLSRGDALQQLSDCRLSVIFSVDLFNEGVDLPAIDTVMMLRPTESKILFLQQLGRGLRKSEEKQHLMVLDFIGNHKSFLHKPAALLECDSTYKQLAAAVSALEQKTIKLPDGCYINYDLRLIQFLKSLDDEGVQQEYQALRAVLGRRPTLSEFYRSGANLESMRQQYGSWFDFLDKMGDINEHVRGISDVVRSFLSGLEKTTLKDHRLSLLEAFQELDGWNNPPDLEKLSEHIWQTLQRRRMLLGDLPDEINESSSAKASEWKKYWHTVPVSALIERRFFTVAHNCLRPTFKVDDIQYEFFRSMIRELIDYRLSVYITRKNEGVASGKLMVSKSTDIIPSKRIELPYFPNLKMACGHFKTGQADVDEYRSVGPHYGSITAERNFIAQASGNSMNGGKHPIHDGDFLLFELVTPDTAGSITGSIMAVERQNESGDNQYLLRKVTKKSDGSYILQANNPDYEDLPATDSMRTLARFKAVLDPLDMAIGQAWQRENIPALFGEEFNPGNWNVGHVVLNAKRAHILLVTLNKRGRIEDHRYVDHWIDSATFHWQSQNSTSPDTKKGQDIIRHEKNGINIHLFVRENRMLGGKAAPFVYHGSVRYKSHTGSHPMSIVFELKE